MQGRRVFVDAGTVVFLAFLRFPKSWLPVASPPMAAPPEPSSVAPAATGAMLSPSPPPVWIDNAVPSGTPGVGMAVVTEGC